VILSALLFLLRIALAIWGLLCFHMNFRNEFLFWGRITLGFSWRLHLKHRLLLVVWPFSHINFGNPWTWEVFPSSRFFFNFFLHCFIVSPAQLSLIPAILPFWGYCEWDCFPDFLLSLFIVSIQKSYSFLYVDFVSIYFAKKSSFYQI
jgi:hypothetical protein